MITRAYRLVAEKSSHIVLAEYAKTLFFLGQTKRSCSFLGYAVSTFSNEWKLELEFVHQLVVVCRLLNRRCFPRATPKPSS